MDLLLKLIRWINMVLIRILADFLEVNKLNKLYKVYTCLEQLCPIDISSMTVMFNRCAFQYGNHWHMWLLNTWNKPSMTEGVKFKF